MRRTSADGERLAFEPSTKEADAQTFDWIARHGIFAEGGWPMDATKIL